MGKGSRPKPERLAEKLRQIRLALGLSQAEMHSNPKRGPVPLSHRWRRFDFTENSMQARERRGELCILRK